MIILNFSNSSCHFLALLKKKSTLGFIVFITVSLLAEGDSQSPKRIELVEEDIFYYARIKR
jgi:hypothetical protein